MQRAGTGMRWVTSVPHPAAHAPRWGWRQRGKDFRLVFTAWGPLTAQGAVLILHRDIWTNDLYIFAFK